MYTGEAPLSVHDAVPIWRYGVSGAGDVTSTTDMFTGTYDMGKGALTVNGQPLSKADSNAIARACAQGLKKPQD